MIVLQYVISTKDYHNRGDWLDRQAHGAFVDLADGVYTTKTINRVHSRHGVNIAGMPFCA